MILKLKFKRGDLSYILSKHKIACSTTYGKFASGDNSKFALDDFRYNTNLHDMILVKTQICMRCFLLKHKFAGRDFSLTQICM